MLIPVRQRRFDAGELAPGLHSRDDIEQFDNGVAEMINFFPTRHGSAVSRPGMQFCGTLGEDKAAGTVPPMLYGFAVTQDLSYILEFGEQYVRFWKRNTATGTTELQQSGGAPYELATPYTLAHAQELKFSQLASSLLVTHPSYAPRELILVDDSPIEWTITEITFDPAAYIGAQPWLVKPFYVDDGTGTHPKMEWEIGVTNLMRRPDGSTYETELMLVEESVQFDLGAVGRIAGTYTAQPIATNKYPIYPDMPMEVDFDRIEVTPVVGADEFLGTIMYRGRGGIMGRVAIVLGDPTSGGDGGQRSQAQVGGGFTESFGGEAWRAIDYGADPDYTHGPPQGRNPFRVDEAGVVRIEDPACCCYFEQRLVFARTDERPNWIWFSAVNSFTDFDEFVEALDEDAFERQIASLEYEEIRSLVPRDRLFVFTSAGVYTFGTGGGEPLSPVGWANATRVSPVGATLLQPLSLPNALLYERAMGGGVRDMAFSNERGGYHDGEVSFLADHLFDGHKLTSWAVAPVPWGLIWATRDDGVLLSLLYDRSRGIVAWSQHDTEGWVERVVVVPEGDEHAVYLACRRRSEFGAAGFFYLERMTDRKVSTVEEAVCLDAAVTYDDGPYTAITLPDHLLFDVIYYVADGEVYGPISPLGEATLTLEKTAEVVHVGLRYTPRLRMLELRAARTKNKLVKRLTLDVERSRGFFVGEYNVLEQEDGPMHEWAQRQVSDDYDTVALETIRTDPQAIASSWNPYGSIIIEQRDPLPLTVLGITREYEDGRG